MTYKLIITLLCIKIDRELMFDGALLSFGRKSNDSHTLPQTPTPVGQKKKKFDLWLTFLVKVDLKSLQVVSPTCKKKQKKPVKKLIITLKLKLSYFYQL